MADDICTVSGCGKPPIARGWCGKHYQRWKNHGDASYVPPRSTNGSKPALFVTIGQRFGRWVVTGPEVRISRTRRGASVKCSCPRGVEKVVAFSDLFYGRSLSCGCLRGETLAEKNREANPAITHGLTGHPLFDTWRKILRRCEYPADKDWPNYGGRGIAVHPSWHDFAVFIADIESEIGPRPEGKHPSGLPLYTLDRINGVTGNYEPGNVRWATALQQRHNRRPPRQCTCGAEYHTTAKSCRACGAALRS